MATLPAIRWIMTGSHLVSVISSLMLNQEIRNRALSEKMAALDLTRLLTLTVSHSPTCSASLESSNLTKSSNLEFSLSALSSSPQYVSLKSIVSDGNAPPLAEAGQKANAASGTLPILPADANPPGLRLAVTSPTSAVLEVNFDQSKLVRPLQNLRIPIGIWSELNGNSVEVTGCTSSFANTDMSCPAGFVMTGMHNNEPLCTELKVASGDSDSDNDGPSPDNPGRGCSGTGCRASDYGPCDGTNCMTNGKRCSGTGCRACSAGGSCSGTGCCAGPSCGGCS
ncbi:MAG: hypothetical protein HC902_05865 [Calothrix sp. SM1_5_4]|nr:hypothetical protein [Calothrix sp. SM1_5_4]